MTFHLKNILIRGGGSSNKGAEAMVLSANNKLKLLCKNTKVFMTHHSHEVGPFKRKGIFELNCTLSLSEIRYLRCLRLLNNRLGFHFDTSTRHRTMVTKREIQTLPKPDIIIDVSGFAYGDDWDDRYVKQTLLWMKHFKPTGTKFIFLPQAWGPFSKIKYHKKYREMLNQADLFYARDTVSQKYLATLLDVPVETISIFPDIAIEFNDGNPQKGKDILNHTFGSLQTKGPMVIICPNRHLYLRSAKHRGVNKYLQILTSIIDQLLADKTNIILLANEINSAKGPKWDDQYICQYLLEAFKDSPHIYFSDKWFSAENVQSILSRADFVLASRFHSAVFSLSKGIPVFSLGWSHKYKELMKLYGLNDYCIDPNLTSPQKVCSQIMHAFKNRMLSKKIIEKKQPEISARLSAMWAKVMETI